MPNITIIAVGYRLSEDNCGIERLCIMNLKMDTVIGDFLLPGGRFFPCAAGAPYSKSAGKDCKP